MLSVSLCREIDNVFGAIRSCFDHVLFFVNPPGSVEDLKNTTFLREIPKTRFMDFGILYENDKGEYVVLNDVRMEDIRLASLRLFTCLIYVSTYCVPIAHLRQNKPFTFLYLGHAQIIKRT